MSLDGPSFPLLRRRLAPAVLRWCCPITRHPMHTKLRDEPNWWNNYEDKLPALLIITCRNLIHNSAFENCWWWWSFTFFLPSCVHVCPMYYMERLSLLLASQELFCSVVLVSRFDGVSTPIFRLFLFPLFWKRRQFSVGYFLRFDFNWMRSCGLGPADSQYLWNRSDTSPAICQT